MPSMSGRTLKTRISEHYNDIRRNTSNHSVLLPNTDWISTLVSLGKAQKLLIRNSFYINDVSQKCYSVAKKQS